ncbi:hypothetical protein AVEN_12757-1 [Araneus ventricosus]|uniref:DUF4371 domain-containing protein n=1 Tax=Araneus ventricosus TaxID=182803 RepID=A0A4Y2ABY8_ARAVE|nr:hypothetical protein AVEN_12757-1 [Araneus ventricosus]
MQNILVSSLDSTSDISHIDQMCEIIRYVHIENKKVEIKEPFLGLFQLTGKKAVDITEDILKVIERDGLDITMCRGQKCDSASILARVHSGVQARICHLNTKALFGSCTNHYLNLCGVNTFETVPLCVILFWDLRKFVRVFLMFYAQMDYPSDKC